jgi:hypothetical protein
MFLRGEGRAGGAVAPTREQFGPRVWARLALCLAFHLDMADCRSAQISSPHFSSAHCLFALPGGMGQSVPPASATSETARLSVMHRTARLSAIAAAHTSANIAIA